MNSGNHEILTVWSMTLVGDNACLGILAQTIELVIKTIPDL